MPNFIILKKILFRKRQEIHLATHYPVRLFHQLVRCIGHKMVKKDYSYHLIATLDSGYKL